MRLLIKVFLLFSLLSLIPVVVVGARIILLVRGEFSQLLPLEIVDAIIDEIVRNSMVYGGYIAVIVLIVAVFFTGSLVSPISRINAMLKRIKTGHYGERVEVETGDEIQELADSLNQMSEKLEESIAELEDENIKRKVYVDILVHDLSNHLTPIEGYTDILSATCKGCEAEFKAVKRNCKRIREMISNVSVLSHLESEERLEFREMNLRAMVEKILEDFSRTIREKGMETRVEGEEVKVEAHSIVEHIFSNLVSNAIKYSPEGSRVGVRIKPGDGRVRVEVVDRGEGVEDEHKELIFQRFSRGEKKGVKGTGLGLAIVRTIARMHSGRVWVEDTPGGGSTFVVELPRKQRKF